MPECKKTKLEHKAWRDRTNYIVVTGVTGSSWHLLGPCGSCCVNLAIVDWKPLAPLDKNGDIRRNEKGLIRFNYPTGCSDCLRRLHYLANKVGYLRHGKILGWRCGMTIRKKKRHTLCSRYTDGPLDPYCTQHRKCITSKLDSFFYPDILREILGYLNRDTKNIPKAVLETYYDFEE